MKNEKYGQPPEENIVIAYVSGKVIMTKPSDEEGGLYFDFMKKEYVTLGEHPPEAELKPLSILSDYERQEIYDAFTEVTT